MDLQNNLTFSPEEIIFYSELLGAGIVFGYLFYLFLKRKYLFLKPKTTILISVISVLTGYFFVDFLDLLPITDLKFPGSKKLIFYSKLLFYSGLGIFAFVEIKKQNQFKS